MLICNVLINDLKRQSGRAKDSHKNLVKINLTVHELRDNGIKILFLIISKTVRLTENFTGHKMCFMFLQSFLETFFAPINLFS
jgi:hypothetical protein